MTPPLFTAADGVVLFDGIPLRQITRARIKNALEAMGRETVHVPTLDRLGGLYIQLIRASINANNQTRKAA